MCYRLKQLLDNCNRTMLITNISARFLFLSFPLLELSLIELLLLDLSFFELSVLKKTNNTLFVKEQKKPIKSNLTSLDSNSVDGYIIKTHTYSEFRFTRLLISQSY